MLKALLHPLMIFIPLGLGFLFPAANCMNFLIRYLLMTMLLLVFLQIKINNLKVEKAHFILLAMNLLMGIVPFFILKLMGYEELALAAFYVGITPTATAAPVVMGFLNGRTGFVITAFVVNNAAISLVLPFLLLVIAGQWEWAIFEKALWAIFMVIGVPALVAAALRKLYPPVQGYPAKLKDFSFLLWSMTLFIIAAGGRDFLDNNPHISGGLLGMIGLISLIICFLNFKLGALVVPHRVCREGSQALGQKNTTFTLYLASTLANPLVAMGPVFYVLWHNVWNAVQMFDYERHKHRVRTGGKSK